MKMNDLDIKEIITELEEHPNIYRDALLYFLKFDYSK